VHGYELQPLDVRSMCCSGMVQLCLGISALITTDCE